MKKKLIALCLSLILMLLTMPIVSAVGVDAVGGQAPEIYVNLNTNEVYSSDVVVQRWGPHEILINLYKVDNNSFKYSVQNLGFDSVQRICHRDTQPVDKQQKGNDNHTCQHD